MSIRFPWGLLVLVALMAAGTADAQMYSWVDGNGGMHFTDDLSQVPPDQRPGAKTEQGERSRIQVVPTAQPKEPQRKKRQPSASMGGSSRQALAPPWASKGLRRTSTSPPSASRRVSSAAPSRGKSRAYWEREFRKLQDGLKKVAQCRSSIPANCSLTRCTSSCRSRWENSSCRGGWVIPSACGQAFDIPGQTVRPRWGGSRSLENFSCGPLREAAEEAERIWQERLDALEAKARAADVPQNWRGD